MRQITNVFIMYNPKSQIINQNPSKAIFGLHTSLFVMHLFVADLLGLFKKHLLCDKQMQTTSKHQFANQMKL